MSEPTRFIGSGGLKGKLLASAKEDRPPKGARRRAILAAAAAAAASTKAASATATLSATASSLGRWAVLKWIAVGALGAGTMVAAKAVILPRPAADSTSVIVSQTTRTNPPAPRARRDAAPAAPPPRDSTSQEAWSLIPPPAQEPPPQDAPPLPSWALPASPTRVDDARAAMATPKPLAPVAAVAPSATLHVEAPEPQSRAERQPTRPETSGSAARGSDGSGLAASSATAVVSSSTLASEIAAIDQAKGALANGDASEALRRVDAYGAAFPVGILAAEATALRIEALARAGRLDEARAALARLRTSHPFSPLLENLGHLVGE